jgi:hypothetical protein
VGWATAGGMALLNQYPTNIIWANSSTTNIVAYNSTSPTYTTPQNPPNTTYYPITCQACHDPHNATPIRTNCAWATMSRSPMAPWSRMPAAGGFCMECHNSRNGSVTNMMAQYPLNQPNWAGGVAFGTHDSPAGATCSKA